MEQYTQPNQNNVNKTNTLAIFGLIFAVLLPIVGFILSIISLNQIKKRNENGKGLAIAGIVVSSIMTIVGLIVIPALLITTFSGVQDKARDAERKVDINVMHSQVEDYYAKNKHYPTLENLNDTAWVKANIPMFEDDVLKDPLGPEPKLAATPANGKYAYVPLSVGGQSCDNADVPCLKYTLTATMENGAPYQKKSLN